MRMSDSQLLRARLLLFLLVFSFCSVECLLHPSSRRCRHVGHGNGSRFRNRRHDLRKSFELSVDGGNRESGTKDMGYFRLPGESLIDSSMQGEMTEFIVDVEAGYVRVPVDKRKGDMRSRVLRQMYFAFDNLREEEVECMYSKLTCNNEETLIERSDIMSKIVELSKRAEDIEDIVYKEANLRGSSYNQFDELADAIRSLRSEIRMYGKDADKYNELGEKQAVISPLQKAISDLKFPWQRK